MNSTMKKLGSVMFLILIVAIIGAVTIIPNFKELFEDHSVWIYAGVLVILGCTIIRTLNQKAE